MHTDQAPQRRRPGRHAAPEPPDAGHPAPDAAPDQVRYVDLRGTGPAHPVEPDRVLDLVALERGAADARIPVPRSPGADPADLAWFLPATAYAPEPDRTASAPPLLAPPPAAAPLPPLERPRPAARAEVVGLRIQQVTAEPAPLQLRPRGRDRARAARGRHAREATFPWPAGWTAPWLPLRPPGRLLAPDLTLQPGPRTPVQRPRGRRVR